MQLASLCQPGGDRPNEDAVAIGQNWGIVVDGASGLNPRTAMGDSSAAAWLAHAFTAALSRQLVDDAGPMDQLAAAAHAEVRDAFAAQLTGAPTLASLDRPSASAVAWRRRADLLEYFLVGDCSLTVESDGRLTTVADPRVARFDAVALAELRSHLAAGASFTAAMAAIRPTLLTNRARKNQPDGYAIVEPVDGWLPAARFGSVTLGEHGRLLACSDGFSALVEPLGIFPNHDSLLAAACADGGLAACQARLVAATNADPDCYRHPRFKKRDDYSGVTAIW